MQDATQPGQGLAEGDDAVELAIAAHRAPLRVIAVLLALARVAARRLQVTAGTAADPDLGIGRWDRQGADALQGGGITYRAAIRATIGKPLASPVATDARRAVTHKDQPGLCGGATVGKWGRRRFGHALILWRHG